MIRPRTITTIFVIASALLCTGHVEAKSEGTLYYVNDFDGAGACGGSDLSWGNDTVGYLKNRLNAWGFDNVYYHGNKWLDFEDMADPSIHSSGDDDVESRGIDSADVGMVYSRGSYTCSGSNRYSSIKMGDSASSCWVQYSSTASGNDSWWDDDLNVMIVDASSSTQKCVITGGSYFHVDTNFAMLLGFHGTNYDSRKHTRNFEDFVDSSRRDGLGHNWVDEMTRRPLGADNDECAVAIVYEDTVSEASKTIHYMGFDDWKSPGSHTKLYHYYLSGCDPRNGNKL